MFFDFPTSAVANATAGGNQKICPHVLLPSNKGYQYQKSRKATKPEGRTLGMLLQRAFLANAKVYPIFSPNPQMAIKTKKVNKQPKPTQALKGIKSTKLKTQPRRKPEKNMGVCFLTFRPLPSRTRLREENKKYTPIFFSRATKAINTKK